MIRHWKENLYILAHNYNFTVGVFKVIPIYVFVLKNPPEGNRQHKLLLVKRQADQWSVSASFYVVFGAIIDYIDPFLDEQIFTLGS